MSAGRKRHTDRLLSHLIRNHRGQEERTWALMR